MAFNPINFAYIQPQGSPFLRNLVENLKEGYKAGQMPQQMERDRQKEELANALAKIQLQFEPENIRSQIDARNALTTMHNRGVGRGGSSMLGGEVDEDGIPLTTAARTSNLKVIQAIDNTLPLIQDLKRQGAPGQFVGKYFSPNDQAAYVSEVGAITDALVGALGLPKTNESIALVQKMVGRHPFEFESHYKERLQRLIEDLNERRKRSSGSFGGVRSNNQYVGMGEGAGGTLNLETGMIE